MVDLCPICKAVLVPQGFWLDSFSQNLQSPSKGPFPTNLTPIFAQKMGGGSQPSQPSAQEGGSSEGSRMLAEISSQWLAELEASVERVNDFFTSVADEACGLLVLAGFSGGQSFLPCVFGLLKWVGFS